MHASLQYVMLSQATALPKTPALGVYRMVIFWTISPPLPVTPPSLEDTGADPGFFSKIFQNFKLSSAAIPVSKSHFI